MGFRSPCFTRNGRNVYSASVQTHLGLFLGVLERYELKRQRLRVSYYLLPPAIENQSRQESQECRRVYGESKEMMTGIQASYLNAQLATRIKPNRTGSHFTPIRKTGNRNQGSKDHDGTRTACGSKVQSMMRQIALHWRTRVSEFFPEMVLQANKKSRRMSAYPL